MTIEHQCIHEEQIMGQSRIIERLDAELGYKKERLDDLKKDNERMENKIDDIQECLNKILLESKKDDEKLNNRLTAIETRLDTQEKQAKNNKDDLNIRIAVVGVILAILTLYFNFLHHI